MVEVNDEGSIAECLECLVVMSIHVADEKVEHGHVDEISQSAAVMIRGHIAHIFITIIGFGFPSGTPTLMIRSTIRVTPNFARSDRLGGQESSKAALDCVWAATDGVSCITVIATLAMETQIVGGRDEECLEEIIVGQSIDLRAHVEHSTHHGRCATKAENAIQVERCNLGIVPFVVGEVKMIRLGLTIACKAMETKLKLNLRKIK